jgi:hypothetical protein
LKKMSVVCIEPQEGSYQKRVHPLSIWICRRGRVSAATDIAEKDSLLQCRDKGCAVKVSFCADNQAHVWSSAQR